MPKNDAPDMFKNLMQMFDPANISKAFDPKAMMESFSANAAGFDPQDTIKTAQGQFDAMTKANEAAAQSYRDLMEKQMEIFQDMTAEAGKLAQAGSAQEASETYQHAVKRALELMTELSEAAQDANTKAYASIKGQVDEAMKDLKS